jgi:selenocysteine-specific elongation factor
MESSALGRRLNIDREAAHGVLDGLSRKSKALRIPGKPPLFLHSDIFDESASTCCGILADFHRSEPLKAGISREELKSRLRPLHPRAFPALLEHLEKDGKIAVDRDLVRLSAHRITLRSDQEEMRRKVEAYYFDVNLRPPVLSSIEQETAITSQDLKETIGLLQREGVLAKISEDLFLHRDRIAALRDRLVSYLGEHGKIDMQKFKEISGLSRKYTIPIMEYFDRSGVTIRVEDHRVLRKT